MEQLLVAFLERPMVLSRRVEHPSAPEMVSTHTATTMTIATHLLRASTVMAAEAAADQLLQIVEPWLTAAHSLC